jgi:hypothetical protein
MAKADLDIVEERMMGFVLKRTHQHDHLQGVIISRASRLLDVISGSHVLEVEIKKNEFCGATR